MEEAEVLERAQGAMGKDITLIYRSQSLTGRLEEIDGGVLVLRQTFWRALRVPAIDVSTFTVHQGVKRWE